MPILPKRKHRQERAQRGRQAAIPLQGLWRPPGAGTDRPVRPGAQGRNPAGVPGTVQPAGHLAHVRGVAPHRGRVAKKTPAVAEGGGLSNGFEKFPLKSAE